MQGLQILAVFFAVESLKSHRLYELLNLLCLFEWDCKVVGISIEVLL